MVSLTVDFLKSCVLQQIIFKYYIKVEPLVPERAKRELLSVIHLYLSIYMYIYIHTYIGGLSQVLFSYFNLNLFKFQFYFKYLSSVDLQFHLQISCTLIILH